MMKLEWADEAAHDLERIVDYISDFNFEAAVRLRDRLRSCAERLSDYPYMFPEGRVPGTREALAHPNYILIYRVRADTVEMLGVVHARRQYP
ncbi:MAG: type II toxin-antitoxin system RelE/ParE family toxin [Candidatus Andeanibacterium colombiense]|uniref:Type II toxin-antitoxin system RelE/ParE family toxin n=1 Tax=Candidatus Andeanibacterium colombiense TaxID=3121345 RepID=A0AAJ6BPZ7_9SPHN|nr:MAG: type II toxin-antitoxin system RelE/ParE family toxin [Sphingomonadaceae bacterium]